VLVRATLIAAAAIAAAAIGPTAVARAEGVDHNPVNATAMCADHLYSHSQTRSGTCSHHGGVAQWCPCDSAPPITTAPPAKVSAGDQLYLGLISQIPGLTITDSAAAIAGAHDVCTGLQDGAGTRADAVAATVRNNPSMTLGQASAHVNAAIAAYCPQFGG
jgi:uncharacterized protein DUF732/uncharacterized protein DUF3761